MFVAPHAIPGAAFRQARVARRTTGSRRGLAAGRAQALGPARLGLVAAALAPVLALPGGVAARKAGGPEPRVPGPAGGGVLLQAGLALAAPGRGRTLAASRAESLRDALCVAPGIRHQLHLLETLRDEPFG